MRLYETGDRLSSFPNSACVKVGSLLRRFGRILGVAKSEACRRLAAIVENGKANPVDIMMNRCYHHDSMRTTISLDEALLKRARQAALNRGISLNELVVTALRLELNRASKPSGKKKITLPTFRGRGLRPGVDLDDTASLEDIMNEAP